MEHRCWGTRRKAMDGRALAKFQLLKHVLRIVPLLALMGSTTSTVGLAKGNASATEIRDTETRATEIRVTETRVTETRVAAGSKLPAPRRGAPAPTLAAGSVTFTGEQGIQLSGLYLPGKERGNAAILLHMDGRSTEDWRPFADRLNRAGFHVLAFDLRGHGKSTKLAGGKSLSYEQLDEAQYLLMVKDVGAAINLLRTRTSANPDAIALVGASVGANIAIKAAAEDPKISNVVLLSPGLEYKGLSSEDAVQRYGERSLFIAVSREDNFAAKSSLVLDSMARGNKALKVYTGAGHGTKMMAREPTLEPDITGWLMGSLEGDVDDLFGTSAPAPAPVRPTTNPPSGK